MHDPSGQIELSVCDVHMTTEYEEIYYVAPRKRGKVLPLACLHVSLYESARIFQNPRILFTSPMAVDRSSSHDDAIRYVLPVMSLNVILLHIGTYTDKDSLTVITYKFAAHSPEDATMFHFLAAIAQWGEVLLSLIALLSPKCR